MEENGINSYKEELERNITRENPSFPDDKTMSDMEMVDNLVIDVSDKEIHDSVDIVEQVSDTDMLVLRAIHKVRAPFFRIFNPPTHPCTLFL